MDKNTVTGLLLIVLIFLVFSIYNNRQLTKGFDSAVAAAETEISNGNLEKAIIEYENALRYRPNDANILDKLRQLNIELGIVQEPSHLTDIQIANDNNLEVIPPQPVDSSRFGPFSKAANGENEFITLENDLIEMKIATKGGRVWSVRLKEFVRHDSTDLILFDGDSTVFGLNFYTKDNIAIKTNDLFFTPVSDQRNYSAVADSQAVALRLMAGEDSYIEYLYSLVPGKYSPNLSVRFRNMSSIIPENQTSLSLDWKMYMPQQEKGRLYEENYSSLKYKYYQEKDVEGPIRATKDVDNFNVSSRFTWVAYQDQFFSSILIADNFFANGNLTMEKTPSLDKYIRYYSSEIGVPYESSASSEFDMKFYFGPNHIKTLRKEGDQLEKIIFVGRNVIGWISRGIIIPVFNFLEKYIGSYGIIILILTILIKIVLFPLTFKSYQSTAKMQIVKPMVDDIAKKYPKKEDELRRQQATMDLYKKAGINVMGGCLPTLLQFPILFAMFRFFPVSIELRQQSFLWATDLSSYDSILDLPFNIPLYGDHVSLFTLLMTVTSILSVKMTNAQSQSGANQMTMKMMTYMMPIMFLFMFNSFPSGLTYYYFLANLITLGQNAITKRMIDKEKVLKTLQENIKKPQQKSKWQKRLEEATKARAGYPVKK